MCLIRTGIRMVQANRNEGALRTTVAQALCDDGQRMAWVYPFVAMDPAAWTQWMHVDKAEAWILECLRCGLDPHSLGDPETHAVQKLLSMRQSFCEAMMRELLGPPRPHRELTLKQNLRVVRSAIRAGELITVPGHDNVEDPSRRLVYASTYSSWNKRTRLPKAGPWPQRPCRCCGRLRGCPSCAGRDTTTPELQSVDTGYPDATYVMVPVETPIHRLIEQVGRHFWRAYQAGKRQPPRVEDVADFLEMELGIPRNESLATIINSVLKPSNTAKGRRA
jgi:hypothetical protein